MCATYGYWKVREKQEHVNHQYTSREPKLLHNGFGLINLFHIHNIYDNEYVIRVETYDES